MAKNISKVTINAPAKKVWDALTKPELVKQWQYGSNLITDWKVDSDILFRSEWEGNVYEQWGKVLEVVPHELIKYSLFAPRPGLEDKPENYFVMSYILNEKEGITLLAIEQDDNRPGAGVEESIDEDEQSVLTVLKKLVEAE
ncbi:SRPBCC domain-containing protein [Bacillus sp. RG28]|uniref:SRPBCC domain-containing protein n=1 Tax=Gottfriedia endophytica TaxID=2820819 RepID=A0A940NK84_9BACI|nr:SRPBCC family protein [Gottfriedia endophytica]MBP0723719.1 SRPBCC domain-containing protein [Gottfriedia endophytica]